MELPAESVLAAGRATPASLCKIPLVSTEKHPPRDPHPTGNSTRARLFPGSNAQCGLGNEQGGEKKIVELFVGQEENEKKNKFVFFMPKGK